MASDVDVIAERVEAINGRLDEFSQTQTRLFQLLERSHTEMRDEMHQLQQAFSKLVLIEERTDLVKSSIERVHARMDDAEKARIRQSEVLEDEIDSRVKIADFKLVEQRLGKLENRVSSMRGWALGLGAAATMVFALVEFINRLQMEPLKDVPQRVQAVSDRNDEQDRVIADTRQRLQQHEDRERGYLNGTSGAERAQH